MEGNGRTNQLLAHFDYSTVVELLLGGCMSLNYRNLDASTRTQMAAEIDADVNAGRLYFSPRLTEDGAKQWPALIKEAALSHTDDWLAAEIRKRGLLKSHEEKRKPTGGTTTAQVPATAADTLSEGEFNRFYARGLCLRAIAENIQGVIAYRARHSDNPRPASEAIVGKTFSPSELLNDLRQSPGLEPALGLPPGPNSGLSVALP